MRREAKLYILSDKDWKPLAAIIESHKDYEIKNNVIVYQLMTTNSINQEYAVLTLSETADKIVEDYGAKLTDEKNVLRNTLHYYQGDTLYGEKSNITFLNKRP